MPNPEESRVHRAVPASASAEYDLMGVAAAMRSLTECVTERDDTREPLERLVAAALERVPGARWTSISMLRADSFTTVASTGEEAVRADALQYEIGSGPCVDAVLRDSLYVTGDVGADPRWGEWGRRASAEVGVNSVLSQRLHLVDQGGVVAGLNVYSDRLDAFDEAAVGVALILATHGALVLSQLLASHRAGNLGKALRSNRDIGVAIGILMQRHHFTRDEAFDVLRVASQNSNRKLADVAGDIVETGMLAIHQRGR